MSLLNAKQQEAAQTLDGPLLIIAGAGSGKTRVLTFRIANLLQQKKARPTEILAVTFTNKAAREMKERVQKIVGGAASQLWIGTFHSSCVKILRQEIEVLGYGSDFVIYDDVDQLTAIKHCFKVLEWDPEQLNPKGIQAHINRAKNQGVSPEAYLERGLSSYDEKVAKLFAVYQRELKKANAVDFGDLLSLTVQIFKNHPDVLKKYQNRFRYCMVDEYQDTNHVQYLFIKLLTHQHQNICVVGDEDQSIYSWRGADISNILSFEKDFSQAKIVKLEQNYRSTRHIIEATAALIANNKDRKPKELWTQNEKGDLIQSVRVEDEYHEARFVTGEILRYQAQEGAHLKDFAIFYRTHAQSRVLEDVLRQNNIPHQIYGGVRFYSRAEIKDILAYFRLIANPKDDIGFLRIINTPARGIGKATLDKITVVAQRERLSLYEAATMLARSGDLNAGARKKLNHFIALMEDLIRAKNHVGLQELYHKIVDKTRYRERLKTSGTFEAESKIENLEELDSALHEFVRRNPAADLEKYLEEMTLRADIDTMDETEDFVKLMTLHSAKGLEFPQVFMVGMEEGLFPHSQSEWDPRELEEERRLCYVGMTRAQKKLCLTHANARRFRGTPQLSLPSRFLGELPKACIHSVDIRRKAAGIRSMGPRTDSLQDDIFEEEFNQDTEEKPFRAGMRIRHPSFGRGVICRVEGEDESTKLTIKFDGGHTKKFLAVQAPLERA